MGNRRFRFGPAGKPIDLKGDLLEAPVFLKKIGLDAMEYEAVRGVNISESKAKEFGKIAEENDVLLSMHAPYYINLSAQQKDTIEKSKERLLDAIRASEWMKSYVVVFHPGYYLDWGVKKAVELVIEALKDVREEANSKGWKYAWLGPETTGKKKQVGSIDDTIEICRNVEKCRPVVDWAHLYARSLGMSIKSKDEVVKIIDTIEKELGNESVHPLHTHFSKIEYNSGGEKEHHTLDENEFGPEFGIVCEAYKETGIEAVIISESPILERDAIKMKNICKE
ncbi:TIM barrel protein [Fervidicoccus fontis]|uniref:TIM barrel protein n=1 Tax=Fervidicoccus fontis TaxID=683846 RepID=A0A843A833_9CREN|nr:TIM barrel protein [Fervidicoccus fontis]MBE9391468.1 TIM barrel protein [Fervidicoccus fontis]